MSTPRQDIPNRKTLPLHEPLSGAGVSPARFMAPMHDLGIIDPRHEPENAVIDFQALMHFR